MKNVVCATEEYLNYLGHLLGVAKVGFDSSYSDTYQHTVQDDDIRWLRDNAHLFIWGDGDQGALSPAVVFLAGYLSPVGLPEIRSLFGTLKRFSRDRDTEALTEAYPALRNLDAWLLGPPTDPYQLHPLSEHTNELVTFCTILERNYDAFLNSVWPNELPKVEARIAEMNRILSQEDWIGQWERLTGRQFRFPIYTFVLGIGIGNGPNFNSLGYEKNWVHYDYPLLHEGIVHEIGTHLLIDIARVALALPDRRTAYNTYETLCDYLTERLLASRGDRRTIVGDSNVYSPAARREIERLYADNPLADPEQVMMSTLKMLTGK
jgi:hypothetical protein